MRNEEMMRKAVWNTTYNMVYENKMATKLATIYSAMMDEIKLDLKSKYIFSSASDVGNARSIYFVALKILINNLPVNERSNALVVMGLFNGLVHVALPYGDVINCVMSYMGSEFIYGGDEFADIEKAYRHILFSIQIEEGYYSVLTDFATHGILNDFVLEKIKITNIINYLSPLAITKYYGVKSVKPLNDWFSYTQWSYKELAKVSNSEYALLMTNTYYDLTYFLYGDFGFSFEIIENSKDGVDSLSYLYKLCDVSVVMFGMKPIKNRLHDAIGFFKY